MGTPSSALDSSEANYVSHQEGPGVRDRINLQEFARGKVQNIPALSNDRTAVRRAFQLVTKPVI
jgi:hypothetical protein